MSYLVMVFLGFRSSNYYSLYSNISLRVQTPLCPTVEVYGWYASGKEALLYIPCSLAKVTASMLT